MTSKDNEEILNQLKKDALGSSAGRGLQFAGSKMTKEGLKLYKAGSPAAGRKLWQTGLKYAYQGKTLGTKLGAAGALADFAMSYKSEGVGQAALSSGLGFAAGFGTTTAIGLGATAALSAVGIGLSGPIGWAIAGAGLVGGAAASHYTNKGVDKAFGKFKSDNIIFDNPISTSNVVQTNQSQALSQFISSGYSKPLNANSLNIEYLNNTSLSPMTIKGYVEKTDYKSEVSAGYAAQINTLPMIMPEALPSSVGSVNTSGFSLMGALKGAGLSIANWFSGLSVFNSRNGTVTGGSSPIMIGGGIDRLFFHSGGTVPGQGEVLAVLRGGERVRTKAQEEELQRELNKKQLLSIMASKEEGNKKRENLPIHMQMTKDDENFILNIIVSAIERNKFGLRNIIRAL